MKTENGDHQKGKIATAILSQEIGYALGSRIILCELREGRESAAIEALEGSMDAQVCMIWRRMRDADRSTTEMALGTLKLIQEYRKKYPRPPIATNLPGNLAESAESMRNEAAEILSRDFSK